MAEPHTIALAKKASQGDRQAFEELCEKKSRDILFTALGFMKNMPDAEDAAQEAIITMYKSIDRLKDPVAVDSWIYTIVRSKCLRMLEKRAVTAMDVDIDDETTGVEPLERDEDFLPEEYVENAAVRKLIYDLIMELPRKRREAIFMFYYDELSLKEISEITGQSVNAISGTLTKARGAIKEALAKREDIVDMLRTGARSSVIGLVLKEQAAEQVSAAALTAFNTKWLASIAVIKFPAAGILAKATSAVAQQVVGAVLAVTVGVSGITFVAVEAVKPPPADTPPSVVATDLAARTGDIIFTGGDCTCGHLNPDSASLDGEPSILADFTITYEVIDEADNAVLYYGDGTDVSTAFAELSTEEALQQSPPHSYRLVYYLRDGKGTEITKSRVFAIGYESVEDAAEDAAAVEDTDAESLTDTDSATGTGTGDNTAINSESGDDSNEPGKDRDQEDDPAPEPPETTEDDGEDGV